MIKYIDQKDNSYLSRLNRLFNSLSAKDREAFKDALENGYRPDFEALKASHKIPTFV